MRDSSKAPACQAPQEPVPVLRPLLPRSERLLPYLRRIDGARSYTNWGPLTCELERRLCEHFQLPPNSVVSAGSGTGALIGAILATAGRATPERPLAIVPAFTFVATAVAVEHCGFRPYLADIDPDSWTIDPERLLEHPHLSRVGIVVPVAAFGRPVRQDVWRAFHRRTGIPVVIDGAASFEVMSDDPGRLIGEIPVALSFHATKSFATGEGGCVVCRDLAVSARAGQALNFGFSGNRSSGSPSTNGKMSEYHAAVGLAELDGWDEKRIALRTVADRYRHGFSAANLPNRFIGASAIGGCYALFRCSAAAEAAGVQQDLADAGIGFRLWYGPGLLSHPVFATLPHDDLGTTEQVAPLLLGLPVAVDLPDSVIHRVISIVRTAVFRVSRALATPGNDNVAF